jgi:protein NirF
LLRLALRLLLLLAASGAAIGSPPLALVVERASGAVQVLDAASHRALGRIEGLGDLSHASLVYAADRRHAYVFGRDGGLSKIDIAARRLVARVVQAGNSIGGAISRDGRIIAVANYAPGGVKLFDAETLELLADIPALGAGGVRSKVVGIVDAPQSRFVFSLFEAGEIWIVDASKPRAPRVTRLEGIGRQPYDGLITPDGRHYIAGLFGEDGVAVVDLRAPERGARRILPGYGRGGEKLPVYKMPHLRGWAIAGGHAFLPAVGRHEVIVVETASWREVATIPVRGQPVFVMARPDARQVWVNFALPANDIVQVIDVASLQVVRTLEPGRAVLHMAFTERGEEVWISARDDQRVVVLDTASFERRAAIAARDPSGIFFTWRAAHMGL